MRPPPTTLLRQAFQSRRLLTAGFAAVSLSTAAATLGHAPAPDGLGTAAEDRMLRTQPMASLVSTWVVYQTCQLPWLVASSEVILGAFDAVPGLRQLSHFVVRHTFFEQFVGGDTAAACLPVIRRLRAAGVGTLLNYSVEAEQGDDALAPALTEVARENVRETIRAIEVAGEENRRLALEGAGSGAVGSTWIGIKLTGLTDPEVLYRASNAILNAREARETSATLTMYPGSADDDDALLLTSHDFTPPPTARLESCTPADLVALRVLYEDMRDIKASARKHGVRILMDAEQSWYQPVTDVFTLLLAKEFNRRDAPDADASPLLYWTFQGYLRRNLEHLQRSFAHAEAHDYTIGAKLVRGAYQEQELAFWERTHQPGPPPVWQTKADTDACYDAALDVVLDKIVADLASPEDVPRVALLAATHNVPSAQHVVEQLEARGLARADKKGVLVLDDAVRRRVCLGQLYGMSDDLTGWIASRFAPEGMPVVLKYVPYGALAQVMPYLSRRAIENKSVLNGERGARMESDRAWGELRRRWFGLRLRAA